MKSNKATFLLFGVFAALIFVDGFFVKSAFAQVPEKPAAQTAKTDISQARKTATKKVPGNVEEEFTMTDDDEKVTSYIFRIRNKKGTMTEIEVDANSGNILGEYEEAEDVPEPPPVDENTDDFNVVSTETVEEQSEAVETETPVSEETAAEPPASSDVVSNNGNNEGNTASGSISSESQPAYSIEQARTIALKKANGSIESEQFVKNEGERAYYSFMIRGLKDKTNEIRVDANSGRARIIK